MIIKLIILLLFINLVFSINIDINNDNTEKYFNNILNKQDNNNKNSKYEDFYYQQQQQQQQEYEENKNSKQFFEFNNVINNLNEISVGDSISQIKTVYGLIERLFNFEMTLFFELKIKESVNDQQSKGQYYYIETEVVESQLSNSSTVIVHITADNGVNLAMGLQHYLKYYCQCSYSWNGDQCSIQSFEQLPPVPEPLLVPVVSNYRYYMNVCTFGYSTVWWNWSRWEREIDWMALNGYNLPLAFVGQEYVWYKVFTQIGLSFDQITQWLTGPAFLPWNRMGNVNGWGGPITVDWLEKQRDLQIQILDRMRSYGMKPVLPGFAGHIPGALQTLFPTANVTVLSTWCDFNGTFYLDPTDSLFGKITQLFIKELIDTFGTDHYYNFDPFNELAPPSSDPGFLKTTSQQMYQNMLSADPKAVWVLQGWFLVDYPEFWQPNQTEAWFSGVPVGGFIVLDLWSDVIPAWNTTEYFYGHYWIWCMLHNFGGRSGMYGRIPFIATNPIEARQLSPNMMGTGLTPEAIEQNVIVYDLMNEMSWRSEAPDLNEWVANYTHRRYGKLVPEIVDVWVGLVDTVFNATAYWARRNMGAPESFIALRPSLLFGNNLFYDPSVMFNAWHVFSLVNDSYVLSTETFQFDIAEITMQSLSNYFMSVYFRLVQSYNISDIESFQRESISIMECISFMDLIASTQSELQLGIWTYRARLWAYPNNELPSLQNSSNSNTMPYEFNARNVLTLWGPSNSVLHDYAFKLWGGLVSDFYSPRWSLFLKTLSQSLENRIPFSATSFTTNVQQLEENWVLQTTIYPIIPFGQGYNTSRYIQSQLQIF